MKLSCTMTICHDILRVFVVYPFFLLSQECKVELDSSKPVIEEGLNYGKSLLLDIVIDNDKKADVKKKVEEIEVELAEMERDNYDRQGK